MEEAGRKRARTVGLVLVAGLVGYLIGPPLVNAATNLVIIKDAGTTRKARVLTGGALKVRPDGGVSFAIPIPSFGADRFATGAAPTETACNTDSVVTEVVLQGGATDTFTVTLTGDTDFDLTADDVVWRGTVGANEHLADTFGSGVFSGVTLTVSTTGTAGEWFVYGLCFGTASNLPAKARAFGR